MLFWDHSCVGLFFDKKENDENLIQKIMGLLEYRRNISLIISGDVLVGPNLSVYGHPTQCYIGEKISPDELFYLLNALFSKVVVYAGAVTVIFDRASYEGKEYTLDPIRGKRFYREFCYCYTEKTAFGKHVDTDNLAEAGTRCNESTIDTFIGEDAFDKCDSLTITAPKGSYAIEYAKAKGIRYIET